MQKINEFVDFLRSQGVVGIAIGLILGAEVTRVVNAFITDLITPILGLLLGTNGSLSEAVLVIGPVSIMYGHFLTAVINFIIVAAVVFFGFKTLRLDKLDKPKESK